MCAPASGCTAWFGFSEGAGAAGVSNLDARTGIGHHGSVGTPFDRPLRAFFTVLALAVIGLPLLGLATHHGRVEWGTVPEWVGAIALLFVAAGVWRLARNDRDRTRTGASH